ncbi:MAG: PAS domain-containing protein, partial [Methanomicrobia archaeon]|nr:PAS domain-containing protein [Methanomicrobia archaeon]
MSSPYKNLFILGTYTLNSESEPVKKLLALELELIRKEMEEEVEKRTKKLRKSEERYRQLFECSMDAAYITTPEGKVTDINQAGLELFGFSRDEFLELSIPDLYVNPNIRGKSKKILEKQGFLRDFEYKVYKKDRTKITVRESCIAVRDEKDKGIMYYGILKDITPQREMERKLSAIYDLSREMTLSVDLDQISKI